MIKVSPETFLECLPFGAALIRSDGTVIGSNAALAALLGDVTGRLCYEALGGRNDRCPFCPFDDLVSGASQPLVGIRQERFGISWSVNLQTLSEESGARLILESVRTINEEEPCDEFRERSKKMFPALLAISRELLGKGPLPKKIEQVLQHIRAGLDSDSDTTVWVEMDEKVLGSPPSLESSEHTMAPLEVEGRTRGHIHVCRPAASKFHVEEVFFLQEAAGLISRQLEIADLETMLRNSKERYRKLARNLAQEVWARTEALTKDTSYLSGVLRCCDDMIITTDLEQRIVEFNLAAEKMLGYTAEEVQGRKITELWVDPEERDRILDEISVTGGVRNYETRLRAKDGSVIEISLTLSLLRDEENKVIGTVGVSKDIGKEKAIRTELERLNQNYKEMIHFINHETKNSLVVMSGFLRRLIKKETVEERKKELEIVYHHSQFLEAMSRDFLLMAELEHGEFQIRKRLITNMYEEVIYPAMIGLKERYPESFESYDTSMGGVGGVSLMGDVGLLEIVYRNLFGNALKYRHPGGKIAYGVTFLGNAYLFNVWNEGPGVPLDQVEKIFEKFYRVQDETTREKRGTGLGLYNIRRIIEAHGGRVWCETQPGQWINFLFILPKE